MQEENGVSAWFERFQNLWNERIFRYIFIVLTAICFFVLVIASAFLTNTDANSARYMLSALMQSQAAIIAIVISLTLIVVQLTASSYSSRVITIFRHSFVWQMLFVLYGTSIFYGLLVLKMIREIGYQNQIIVLDPSLESFVFIAYVLGIFTF